MIDLKYEQSSNNLLLMFTKNREWFNKLYEINGKPKELLYIYLLSLVKNNLAK